MDGDSSVTHLADAGAGAILVLTLNQWLPAIASLVTILWVMLRFWESDTMREWTGRVKPVQTVYVVRDEDQDDDSSSLDPSP